MFSWMAGPSPAMTRLVVSAYPAAVMPGLGPGIHEGKGRQLIIDRA
jgi:hypothetical protein